MPTSPKPKREEKPDACIPGMADTSTGPKQTSRQQLTGSWLLSGEPPRSGAEAIFTRIFAGYRTGHVLAQAPGCHGRLPAPQPATPPQPGQRAAGQAEGRPLLPLRDPAPKPAVPPGPRQHRGLRTAPPARSAPRSPARAPRTPSRLGLCRPAPRRTPPAGPRPPRPLLPRAAAGLSDLLGRRCRRRCRHLPAPSATALRTAAAPRTPAPAPWLRGWGAPRAAAPPGGREVRRPCIQRFGLGARLPAHGCSRELGQPLDFAERALQKRISPLPSPSVPITVGWCGPEL